MMVGAIGRLKDKYPNIRLVITGEVSDDFHREYKKRLEAFIKEQGLEEYVTLKSNLNREQVAEEYRNADIYVLASTGEPASITVIESMAYSVPSISGTDNGTADYITPGVTGEVYRDCDEEDLVRAMERIIENPVGIQAMGKAGYEYITAHHRFEDYYSVIKQMLEDSSKGI
jgi:glycosyltransferase involved in cell wall biosynthesis